MNLITMGAMGMVTTNLMALAEWQVTIRMNQDLSQMGYGQLQKIDKTKWLAYIFLKKNLVTLSICLNGYSLGIKKETWISDIYVDNDPL